MKYKHCILNILRPKQLLIGIGVAKMAFGLYTKIILLVSTIILIHQIIECRQKQLRDDHVIKSKLDYGSTSIVF